MLHDIDFASLPSCDFNELVGEGETQQKNYSHFDNWFNLVTNKQCGQSRHNQQLLNAKQFGV
jgi:hypothetical protein